MPDVCVPKGVHLEKEVFPFTHTICTHIFMLTTKLRVQIWIVAPLTTKLGGANQDVTGAAILFYTYSLFCASKNVEAMREFCSQPCWIYSPQNVYIFLDPFEIRCLQRKWRRQSSSTSKYGKKRYFITTFHLTYILLCHTRPNFCGL